MRGRLWRGVGAGSVEACALPKRICVPVEKPQRREGIVRHHTTDPAKRAEHVANREEREYEMTHDCAYGDWPDYWLKPYREALKEFTEAAETGGM
jgi:hypothetical protein